MREKVLSYSHELGHISIKVIFNIVSNSRLKSHSTLFIKGNIYSIGYIGLCCSRHFNINSVNGTTMVPLRNM